MSDLTPIKWTGGVTAPAVPAAPTTPLVIDSKDHHDGQGFDPDCECPDRAAWDAFKADLDGVLGMSFRLRDVATDEILDEWVAP